MSNWQLINFNVDYNNFDDCDIYRYPTVIFTLQSSTNDKIIWTIDDIHTVDWESFNNAINSGTSYVYKHEIGDYMYSYECDNNMFKVFNSLCDGMSFGFTTSCVNIKKCIELLIDIDGFATKNKKYC